MVFIFLTRYSRNLVKERANTYYCLLSVSVEDLGTLNIKDTKTRILKCMLSLNIPCAVV